jgi:hypothetical protein
MEELLYGRLAAPMIEAWPGDGRGGRALTERNQAFGFLAGFLAGLLTGAASAACRIDLA